MIKRIALCTIFLLLIRFAVPGPAAAQTDAVTEVINLVNGVRAEVGLPPYRIDPALMVAAQRHSEWGSSVGYFSHEGADGSRPTDRAVAAGYGGYDSVRVSENIYWGTNATPQSAVEWWRNSSIHYRGMTSSTYQDLGVGVAYGESGGYFTLLFGVHTADIPAPPPSGGSQGGQGQPPVVDVPEIPEIATAAPQPDGSIIHVVEEGQAIWNIAAAYQVNVLELMALNGFTDASVIHPGNEVLVRAANTPTPIPSPTLPPTATRPPTLTPLPGQRGLQPQPSPTEPASGLTIGTQRTVRSVLWATLVLGAGLIGVGVVSLRIRA